jgi:hypothetical protein
VIRRLIFLGIATIAVVASTSVAVAQPPNGAQQPDRQTTGKGMAAIQQAASADKYVFVFFWKEKSQQTSAAWSILQSAIGKVSGRAESVAINVSDPAEKQVVDRYGASRAPMPLVLAIAPCGAITKGLTGRFGEQDLRAAFVSPCTELCLKALQGRKLVLLCVVDQARPDDLVAVPQGVQDFKADQQYGPATEVVLLNARDEGEATFLKELKVDPQTQRPLTVLLAPPGSLVGKFDGTATKQQLVAKLASAQSNPCAGGKCGPGGCGPKR